MIGANDGVDHGVDDCVGYDMTDVPAIPGKADVELLLFSVEKVRGGNPEELSRILIVHTVRPGVFFQHPS